MQEKILICTFANINGDAIGTTQNSNKMIRMLENSDGTFTPYTGRVETNKDGSFNFDKLVKQKPKPMSEWDKYLREKTKTSNKPDSRYTDVTDIRKQEVPTTTNQVVVDIFNITGKAPEVRNILKKLHDYSFKKVTENFSVTVNSVTEKMLERANEELNKVRQSIFVGGENVTPNQYLLEYYRVIPRTMKDVRNHVISDRNFTSVELASKWLEFISKEQDLIDTLTQQVKSAKANIKNLEDSNTQVKNLIDILGIEVDLITEHSKVEMVKNMMESSHRNKFAGLFLFRNPKNTSDYEKWIAKSNNKNSKLLWHGTRSANILPIAETGLKTSPPAQAPIAGKAFGFGIYAASEFDKSLNYTSYSGSSYSWRGDNRDNEGFLFLCNFHYGNAYQYKAGRSGSYSDLTYQKLQERYGKDVDSFHAVGGVGGAVSRHEYIVYNNEQIATEYLLQVK